MSKKGALEVVIVVLTALVMVIKAIQTSSVLECKDECDL